MNEFITFATYKVDIHVCMSLCKCCVTLLRVSHIKIQNNTFQFSHIQRPRRGWLVLRTPKNIINIQYVNPTSKSFFYTFKVQKYIFIVCYFHIHDPYLVLLYHQCLIMIILLRIKNLCLGFKG